MIDCKRGNEIFVQLMYGRKCIVVQSPCGLYYLNINKPRCSALVVSFVDSVDTGSENITKNSNHDYSDALFACKIRRIIGGTSRNTFLNLLNSNLLQTVQSPVIIC